MVKNSTGATWLSIALVVCLVLAPSNLFLKFDQFDWAVRGLRVDYLLPKLYLSDLAALGSIFIAGASGLKRLKIRFSLPLLLTLSLLIIWLGHQFFTPYPVAAVSSAMRLMSYATLWMLVRSHWANLKHTWLWWGLVISIISQSGLAIYQFITQHPLGNYYWLLGEPNFVQTHNTVTGNFRSWGELLLPYGTTAHPNILAGWITSGWLLLIIWWQSHLVQLSKWQKILVILLGCLTGIIIWLTQAWSAAGLLGMGLVWLAINRWHKNYIFPLITLIFSSPWWIKFIFLAAGLTSSLSVSRRIWLSDAAIKIWQSHPWLGTGLSQFTAYLESTARQPELVRFVQPAHQVGWLWLAETGILGLALIGSLSWLIHRSDRNFLSRFSSWLWIAFPLLIWDHYLLTIPTGLWLSWWWLMPQRDTIYVGNDKNSTS